MTCKLKNLISEYWDWTDHPQSDSLRMCENNFVNSHRFMATQSDLWPGPHTEFDKESSPGWFLDWMIWRVSKTATMP